MSKIWVVAGLLGVVVAGVQGQSLNSATTRSPHGKLDIPCQNCHTLLGWKPIRASPEFDHDKTEFPLRGMHENLPCTQCHTRPVFGNTGNTCADCHADMHRRQMGSNCARCHTVKGWQVTLQSIGNHENRFPLVGGTPGCPATAVIRTPQ